MKVIKKINIKIWLNFIWII